jgi:hypothetical protein
MVCAALDILQLDNCISYYADKDLEAYVIDRSNRCEFYTTLDGDKCKWYLDDEGDFIRPTSSAVRDAYLDEISTLMQAFYAGDGDQSFKLDDDYVASIIN